MFVSTSVSMLVVLKSLLLDVKLYEDRDCIFFVPTVYQSITVNKCLLNKNELTVKCQIDPTLPSTYTTFAGPGAEQMGSEFARTSQAGPASA